MTGEATTTPRSGRHPRRVSGSTEVTGVPTVMRVPTVVTNVSVLGAVWSLVALVLHHHSHPAVRAVTELFDAFNVPVGPGVLEAVILVILAVAASRHKRIALWAVLVLQLLGGISSVTTLVEPEGYDPLSLVVACVSVTVALASVPVLLWARPAFAARTVKGSVVGALLILVTGLGLNLVLGLLAVRIGSMRHQTHALQWLLSKVFGTLPISFFTDPVTVHGPRGLGVLLSLVSAVVMVLALFYFLRGQRMPGRTPEDDLFVRGLLARWGEDSLGYFATRDDRSEIASTDRRAAVSYGVAAGVSLVGGDPLGDPQSWDDALVRWREQCARFGWVPAAISVSEAGARAFRNQGFTVKSMGDEAVVHTHRFDLNAPQMRTLAQAVRRARREGVEISIRQLGDIDEGERVELARAAETFRHGEERGFSMSLERILEPIDARTTVVSARGGDGAVQALLTFVPWGSRGLSLTLMRRSPTSVNGIVEAMVVALIEQGRETSVERISLNFAMFRRVFDEGTAVDATWTHRLTRRIMLVASRFWQLDSLYESNARYQPEWVPRYFCFLSYAEATAVIVASGVLEGFLPQLGARTSQRWRVTPEHLSRVRALEERAVEEAAPAPELSEQERVRRSKAERLRKAGMEPWPPGVGLGEEPSALVGAGSDLAPGGRSGRRVRTGGRIRAERDHGGVVFVDVERRGRRIQAVLDASVLPAHQRELWRLTDIGDIVALEGELVRTARGEVSVEVSDWVMAAKSLRPLPARGAVLDARTRTRQRVVQFLTDPTSLDLLRMRSRALAEVRAVLSEKGFLEVETPMLHAVKGGANARPFLTHYNAYGTDVFLRIAPELFLKRLAVGGMDAIFEMGRSFRNEGADSTHNPEFTSLEAYRAGGDYTTMRLLTQELIQRAARAVNGSCVCLRPVGSPGTDGLAGVARLDGTDLAAVDLSGEWPVVAVHEAVSNAVGATVTPDTPVADLVELCHAHDVQPPALPDEGALVGALYDALVEARTVHPTFYTDFPKSSSPLTRAHRRDPRLAERWDLVAFGTELGTAYTELTDPVDQRQRFTEQSLAAAAGDPEAMSIDTAFLDDLELGLTPTGGLGIGMDRMVMLLTGSTIRQVLAFPFVRPLSRNPGVR